MSNIGKNAGSDKDKNTETPKTLFAGAPPTSDDPSMRYVLDKVEDMRKKIERQGDEIKAVKARHEDGMKVMKEKNERQEKEIKVRNGKIEHQEKEMEAMKKKIDELEDTNKSLSLHFKARYVKLGGDTVYNSNLEDLRKSMRDFCNDDEEDLKNFDAWARTRNRNGNIKVLLTMVGGAVIGSGIGGVVAGAYRLGVDRATPEETCRDSTAATATEIVVLCAVVGLLLAFALWGIYKVYNIRKMKKITKVE